MNSKFDLGWGDPACVREAFLSFNKLNHVIEQNNGGYRFGAQCHNLEKQIQLLSCNLLGIQHKHIILVNGAMQGLDASLSFCKNKLQMTKCLTNEKHFPHYPGVIKKNGLFHAKFTSSGIRTVHLIDSPSNPDGKIYTGDSFADFIIWDAVYNNPIYKAIATPPIKHDIAIGSFGKLFGLPGLRIGWVATNSEEAAKYIRNHIEITTCGVSSPAQIMIEEILEHPYWVSSFLNKAASYINSNKTEFLKVKHIFDGQTPDINGMFFFPEIDPKALEILSKAGVEFTPGEACGDASGSHIRLNMAQTNEIISAAVKAILKADRA